MALLVQKKMMQAGYAEQSINYGLINSGNINSKVLITNNIIKYIKEPKQLH